MTHPHTCIAPISQRLEASPWQQLPEMAANYRAERAGIEAALRLLEAFHVHHALRLKAQGQNRACTLRLTAATQAAILRTDIVGAMR